MGITKTLIDNTTGKRHTITFESEPSEQDLNEAVEHIKSISPTISNKDTPTTNKKLGPIAKTYQNWKEGMTTALEAPTLTGRFLKLSNPDILPIPLSIAETPERFINTLGQTVASGFEGAGRLVNRSLGGVPLSLATKAMRPGYKLGQLFAGTKLGQSALPYLEPPQVSTEASRLLSNIPFAEPIKTAQIAVGAAKPVLNIAGKATETIGTAAKQKAIKGFYGSLGEGGKELSHIGPSKRESVENLWKNITDFDLQKHYKNPWKLADESENKANRFVDAATNKFKEKAFVSKEKINPMNIAIKAAEDMSDIDADEIVNYKKAMNQIIAGLKEKSKYSIDPTIKKGGFYQQLPVSSLLDFKKALSPTGKIFTKSVAADPLDPVKKTIKKKMMLAILDEIGRVSPETQAWNRNARKLYEISNIADRAVLNPKDKSLLKNLGKFTLGGGLTGAALQTPGMIKSIASMTGGSPVDATTIALSSLIGGGLYTGGKIATNPRVQYGSAKLLKNIGLSMQGKEIPKINIPGYSAFSGGKSLGVIIKENRGRGYSAKLIDKKGNIIAQEENFPKFTKESIKRRP